MHDTTDFTELKEKTNDKALEQKHLHDVTTLAAEIKRLLVLRGEVLKEAGVRREMQKLENWLETERKGPAPAQIISDSGIVWLTGLRDKLRLMADESQRLEGEGGNPSSKEQIEKIEQVLETVRRIDTIISDSPETKPH